MCNTYKGLFINEKGDDITKGMKYQGDPIFLFTRSIFFFQNLKDDVIYAVERCEELRDETYVKNAFGTNCV